jgi:hypothetical protein
VNKEVLKETVKSPFKHRNASYQHHQRNLSHVESSYGTNGVPNAIKTPHQNNSLATGAQTPIKAAASSIIS